MENRKQEHHDFRVRCRGSPSNHVAKGRQHKRTSEKPKVREKVHLGPGPYPKEKKGKAVSESRLKSNRVSEYLCGN